MALTLKELIDKSLEFYIPAGIVRNYSDEDRIVSIIDWSKCSENSNTLRVQLKGHYNGASSTGDYYIKRANFESFLNYFNENYYSESASVTPFRVYNKFIAGWYECNIIDCDYIFRVQYGAQYNYLQKCIPCNICLEPTNDDTYLEIESESYGTTIVKVMQIYKKDSIAYMNVKSNVFPRKVLRVTSNKEDIAKWFHISDESSIKKYDVEKEERVPTFDEPIKAEDECTVEPDYKAYYERYLVIEKELMEAKEVIFKQACEIYNLKSKMN